MKSSVFAGLIVLAMAGGARANTIADWTFETSQPTTAGPYSPEVGSGSATGSHAGSSTYTNGGGNGSAHSYTSSGWAVGDYWQFAVSTVGETGIQLSWDQAGTNTGPSSFALQYSTGGAYTTVGSVYAVALSSWTNGTYMPAFTFNVDLSGTSALNNAPTVTFRLVDQSTTSIGGGTVAGTGTDRVDNFLVTGTPTAVPLPNAAFAGLGMLALMGIGRRLKRV